MVLDIQQLQDRARRDPTSYRDEFLLQHRRFIASLEVMRLRPDAVPDEFPQLVNFLAHVAESYKTTLADLPAQLTNLVDGENCQLLDPEVRKAVVSALILLRNRGLIEPTASLPVFFRLFRVQDKQLRGQLYKHIVNDVRNINKRGSNEKTNRTLQNFMYNMVTNPDALAAQKSLEVIIELYRRKLWADARSANVIATAVFSENLKQRVTALSFFLRVDDQMAAMKAAQEDSDDDSEDEKNMSGKSAKEILQLTKKEMMDMAKKEGKGVRRTTAKDERKMKKLKNRLKKRESREEDSPASSALHHIYDPTDFTERLFAQAKKARDKFDVKMMMLNMIGRLISTHRLILLNFYPFLQRYLQPHQKEVTHILSYLAEATHELVPFEDLRPLVNTICHNFITERNSNEAIAVGLNTVRIMASRVPLVLEADLVHDLVEYKSHKDKGVVMAARALLEVYRVLDPSKLVRKERGKGHDLRNKPQAYGADIKPVATEMPGLELLDQNSESEDDDDVAQFKSEIRKIYAEHNPKKLEDVDGLVEQYEGREDELMAKIRRKYVRKDSAAEAAIQAERERDEAASAEEGDESDSDDDDDDAEEDVEVGSWSGDSWTAEQHAAFLSSLGRHGTGAVDLEKAWVAISKELGRGEDGVMAVKAHAAVYFRVLSEGSGADDAEQDESSDDEDGGDSGSDESEEEEQEEEVDAGSGEDAEEEAAAGGGAKRKLDDADETPASDESAEPAKKRKFTLKGHKKRMQEARLEREILANEAAAPEDRPAPSVSGMDRILTQEEHMTIRRRELAMEVESTLNYKGEKGVVRVEAEDIEGYKTKVKLDRAEKIRIALEGRAERSQFGSKKEKNGKHQSTNKMNEKNKNYMMIQMKMQKGRSKLTIQQKKRGTGFEAKMKQKGRKQQLGMKARKVEQSRKKTR
jgi:protein SDA1